MCYAGKDNYRGKVFDDAFNETAMDHNYRPNYRAKDQAPPPKNVAFYHRYFTAHWIYGLNGLQHELWAFLGEPLDPL